MTTPQEDFQQKQQKLHLEHIYNIYGWAIIGGIVLILFTCFLTCRWLCKPKNPYKKDQKLFQEKLVKYNLNKQAVDKHYYKRDRDGHHSQDARKHERVAKKEKALVEAKKNLNNYMSIPIAGLEQKSAKEPIYPNIPQNLGSNNNLPYPILPGSGAGQNNGPITSTAYNSVAGPHGHGIFNDAASAANQTVVSNQTGGLLASYQANGAGGGGRRGSVIPPAMHGKELRSYLSQINKDKQRNAGGQYFSSNNNISQTGKNSNQPSSGQPIINFGPQYNHPGGFVNHNTQNSRTMSDEKLNQAMTRSGYSALGVASNRENSNHHNQPILSQNSHNSNGNYEPVFHRTESTPYQNQDNTPNPRISMDVTDSALKIKEKLKQRRRMSIDRHLFPQSHNESLENKSLINSVKINPQPVIPETVTSTDLDQNSHVLETIDSNSDRTESLSGGNGVSASLMGATVVKSEK